MQHGHAPRPLPLFLELVREAGEHDPELARRALAGLRAYEAAPRGDGRPEMPEAARVGPASLRDHGGDGPPAILVPSLINPPRVLDLDAQVSLAEAVKAIGRRVLLLDWGPANKRGELDVAGHVSQLLVPLIRSLDEKAALIGYCLGGTMAIAAANLVEAERVATLASPWRFNHYPRTARDALLNLWRLSRPGAEVLGALPMEVLQAAFWSLDPARTVAKFADFASLEPGSAKAERFIALEDWANEGEALPFPAAAELMEHMFGNDMPGKDRWLVGDRRVSDRIGCPLLNLTADDDRIAPAATAPAGKSFGIPSGHVGMVVGSARAKLHEALGGFLKPG